MYNSWSWNHKTNNQAAESPILRRAPAISTVSQATVGFEEGSDPGLARPWDALAAFFAKEPGQRISVRELPTEKGLKDGVETHIGCKPTCS